MTKKVSKKIYKKCLSLVVCIILLFGNLGSSSFVGASVKDTMATPVVESGNEIEKEDIKILDEDDLQSSALPLPTKGRAAAAGELQTPGPASKTPEVERKQSKGKESDSKVNLDDYTLQEMPEVVEETIEENGSKPVAISTDGAENLNSVTVINKDDTKTLHIFPYDIKYVEENKLKFITDKISFSDSKTYEYKNVDGSLSRHFSKNPESGVKLACKNRSVALAPFKHKKKMKSSRNIRLNDIADATCKKGRNNVVYDNVFTDHTAIKYTSAINGIKEDILLSEYDGINTFCFTIHTNGLIPATMEADQEEIPLLDPETNEVEMVINQIIAFDSVHGTKADDGEHVSLNHKMTLEKTEEKDEYILTLVVDEKFLNSENTVYPVTIDPAITIPASYIQNTMVNELIPTAGNWSSNSMYVGKHVYFGDCQMFMRLTNISDYSYIPSSNINHVMFNIYEFSGWTTSATVDLFDLASSSWTYNGINYNNKPNTYGARQSYKKYPPTNTWSEFEITSLFEAWLNDQLGQGGYTKDYGFCLKANNADMISRFYYQSADTSKPPTITVNYKEDTSVTDGLYYIRNLSTGRYLEAEQKTSGRNVVTSPLHGNSSQQWKIVSKGNGLYTFYNEWPGHEGYMLDTDTGETTTNADLYSAEGPWTKYRIVKK